MRNGRELPKLPTRSSRNSKSGAALQDFLSILKGVVGLDKFFVDLSVQGTEAPLL